MTITFKKLKYGDLSEPVRKAVMTFDTHEVTIDDSVLSRVQLKKLLNYLKQEGYLEQP